MFLDLNLSAALLDRDWNDVDYHLEKASESPLCACA